MKTISESLEYSVVLMFQLPSDNVLGIIHAEEKAGTVRRSPLVSSGQ